MSDRAENLRHIVADPARGPELQWLLGDELAKLVGTLASPAYDPAEPLEPSALLGRLREYADATGDAATAMALVGYWAPSQSARVAASMLYTVASSRDRGNGLAVWRQLHSYPARLLFYAFGLGAVASANYGNLALLFKAPVLNGRN